MFAEHAEALNESKKGIKKIKKSVDNEGGV